MEVTQEDVVIFLRHLRETFYADADEALNAVSLDRAYLERAASQLEVRDLLQRALGLSGVR